MKGKLSHSQTKCWITKRTKTPRDPQGPKGLQVHSQLVCLNVIDQSILAGMKAPNAQNNNNKHASYSLFVLHGVSGWAGLKGGTHIIEL